MPPDQRHTNIMRSSLLHSHFETDTQCCVASPENLPIPTLVPRSGIGPSHFETDTQCCVVSSENHRSPMLSLIRSALRTSTILSTLLF